MPVRQSWLLFLLAALMLTKRPPMAPGQRLTLEGVNLAYSVGYFDARAPALTVGALEHKRICFSPPPVTVCLPGEYVLPW